MGEAKTKIEIMLPATTTITTHILKQSQEITSPRKKLQRPNKTKREKRNNINIPRMPTMKLKLAMERQSRERICLKCLNFFFENQWNAKLCNPKRKGRERGQKSVNACLQMLATFIISVGFYAWWYSTIACGPSLILLCLYVLLLDFFCLSCRRFGIPFQGGGERALSNRLRAVRADLLC